MAREDVLDVVSEGADSCENWRKLDYARCADANDCGKGGSIFTPALVVTVTLSAPGTVTLSCCLHGLVTGSPVHNYTCSHVVVRAVRTCSENTVIIIHTLDVLQG